MIEINKKIYIDEITMYKNNNFNAIKQFIYNLLFSLVSVTSMKNS